MRILQNIHPLVWIPIEKRLDPFFWVININLVNIVGHWHFIQFEQIMEIQSQQIQSSTFRQSNYSCTFILSFYRWVSNSPINSITCSEALFAFATRDADVNLGCPNCFQVCSVIKVKSAPSSCCNVIIRYHLLHNRRIYDDSVRVGLHWFVVSISVDTRMIACTCLCFEIWMMYCNSLPYDQSCYTACIYYFCDHICHHNVILHNVDTDDLAVICCLKLMEQHSILLLVLASWFLPI